MLLVAHIILALSSLPLMLAAIVNEFMPLLNNKRLLPRASAISFVGLVGTGTALIIIKHLPVLGACMEGLAYLAGLAVFYSIYKKFARKSSVA